MDNLSATALAARKAGMSYGQYVALNGVRFINKPIVVDVPTKICPECGNKFSLKGRRADKVYCDAECQRRFQDKRAMQRYHERKKGNNNG